VQKGGVPRVRIYVHVPLTAHAACRACADTTDATKRELHTHTH
jgi:hypothetical protein